MLNKVFSFEYMLDIYMTWGSPGFPVELSLFIQTSKYCLSVNELTKLCIKPFVRQIFGFWLNIKAALITQNGSNNYM